MSTQYLFVADTKAALYKLQVQTQIMAQSLAVMLWQQKFNSIGPWDQYCKPDCAVEQAPQKQLVLMHNDLDKK